VVSLLREFAEIVDDFCEIGVDVLNISQPNVVDIPPIGRPLRGKQCFLMPMSYQTVSISGTVADIYAEAQRLYDLLGTPARIHRLRGGIWLHGHVAGKLSGLRRGIPRLR